jgi:hypothetical protein
LGCVEVAEGEGRRRVGVDLGCVEVTEGGRQAARGNGSKVVGRCRGEGGPAKAKVAGACNYRAWGEGGGERTMGRVGAQHGGWGRAAVCPTLMSRCMMPVECR